MILLIDDSDNERVLIRKMLESGGHYVREAASGDEGLALFGTILPDLVLCDLMMPLKDGFTTIDDIQKLAPGTKIIAMSGVWYGAADHAAQARQLGLIAVIEKPFEREQLLRVVAKALAPKAAPKKAKPKRRAKPKRPAKARRAKKAKPARKAKRRTKARRRR